MARVATIDGVNMRSQRQYNQNNIILTIPYGAVVDVYAIDQYGWAEVGYNNEHGYAASWYLKKINQPLAAKEEEKNLGSAIVEYARNFIGIPYVWGGASLQNGADCSGFVQAVFAKFNIILPHNASMQSKYGTYISRNDLLPGDLLFFSNPDHVAIYIGDGKIIHSTNSKNGVVITNAFYRVPYTQKRMWI